MVAAHYVGLCFFLFATGSYAQEPKLHKLHVISEIRSRFAITTFVADVINPSLQEKRAKFFLQIPSDAYITNVTSTTTNRTSTSRIIEIEDATEKYHRNQFQQARYRFGSKPRDTHYFEWFSEVAPRDNVIFTVTYVQKLQAVHGLVRHVLNLNLDEVIRELKVDVYITEPEGLTKILVPPVAVELSDMTNRDLLKLKTMRDVTFEQIVVQSQRTLKISFSPDAHQQRDFSNDGVDGQFLVLYEIPSGKNAGQFDISNGFFIHHFSPNPLPRNPKNVMFLLDKGSAMYGFKATKLQAAVTKMIYSLEDEDIFNVGVFSDSFSRWERVPQKATRKNLDRAVEFLKEQPNQGEMYLDFAIDKALRILARGKVDRVVSTLFVVAEGDREPHEIRNRQTLRKTGWWQVEFPFSMNIAGVGSRLDESFARILTAANNGVYRKIATVHDMDRQLFGFFKEVSDPLLVDVSVEYPASHVHKDSIVRDTSPILYLGAELAGAGQLKLYEDARKLLQKGVYWLNGTATGRNFEGKQLYKFEREVECWETCVPEVDHSEYAFYAVPPLCKVWRRCPFPPELLAKTKFPANILGGHVEWAWAFMKVKQLIESTKYDNIDERHRTKFIKYATELSLQYHFLNDLTALLFNEIDSQKIIIKGESKENLLFLNTRFFDGPVIEDSNANRTRLQKTNLDGKPPKCYKVFHKKWFRPLTNYRNESALSRDECMARCFRSSFCQGALYAPLFKHATGLNCQMVYQRTPPCALSEYKSLLEDLEATVFMFCLTCKPQGQFNIDNVEINLDG